MPPIGDGDYCWAHDPQNARRRAEARRKGGQSRQAPKSSGTPDQYRTVDALQGLLEQAVADTLLQENTDKRSRTIAILAGGLMRAIEVGEFDERLAALESTLGRKKIG